MFTHPKSQHTIVLFLALMLALLATACAPAQAGPALSEPAAGAAEPAAVAAAPDLADLDPQTVVQSFYDAWLEYGRYTGNPLVNEYYKDSGYLSQSGIARLEAAKGPQGWVADPVLCAQDLPESVTVESSIVEDGTASVLALTSWDTRLGVDLVQVEGQWLIDSITCLGR